MPPLPRDSFSILTYSFSTGLTLVCFLKGEKDLFCMSVVACMYACHVYTCRCLWRPEAGVRSPTAGVTDGFKLPDVDAGNEMWVLCRAVNAFWWVFFFFF